MCRPSALPAGNRQRCTAWIWPAEAPEGDWFDGYSGLHPASSDSILWFVCFVLFHFFWGGGGRKRKERKRKRIICKMRRLTRLGKHQLSLWFIEIKSEGLERISCWHEPTNACSGAKRTQHSHQAKIWWNDYFLLWGWSNAMDASKCTSIKNITNKQTKKKRARSMAVVKLISNSAKRRSITTSGYIKSRSYLSTSIYQLFSCFTMMLLW